jgi:hypothetical protein
MSNESGAVEGFCKKVNQENDFNIYGSTYNDLVTMKKDMNKQVGTLLKVMNRIEDFLDNHVFCDCCGERIYEKEESHVRENEVG